MLHVRSVDVSLCAGLSPRGSRLSSRGRFGRSGARGGRGGGHHARLSDPADGLRQPARPSRRGSPAGSRPGRWRSAATTRPKAGPRSWSRSTTAPSGAKMTEEVAARLKAKVGLKRERFVICSTHTHCAPALEQRARLHLRRPAPADQKERIERYTRELTDAIEKVALAALADRAPGEPGVGPGPGRLRGQPAGAQEGQVGQLRGQSRTDRSITACRCCGRPTRRARSGPCCSATPATARPWAASSTRSAPSGPATPATRSSGSRPAPSRWRSSAAGPTPTPSRGATSTTPSSTGRRRGREVNRLCSRSALDPPARPDRVRGSARSSCRWSRRRTAPRSSERTKRRRLRGLSSPGASIERLDRGETLPTTRALPRPDLVLRRRHGHGLPRRRGRRRLRAAAQVGDRRSTALGRRLQQRRALLHPVAADPRAREATRPTAP